jgi:hypothetical protein
MGSSLRAIAALAAAVTLTFGAATAAAQSFTMLAGFEQGPRHPDGRLLAVGENLLYGVTARAAGSGMGPSSSSIGSPPVDGSSSPSTRSTARTAASPRAA